MGSSQSSLVPSPLLAANLQWPERWSGTILLDILILPLGSLPTSSRLKKSTIVARPPGSKDVLVLVPSLVPPDPLPAAILLRAGKVGLVPMRQNLGSKSADPQTNQIAHLRILMK